MCIVLGDKSNGSIIFDIRGQREVLMVKFRFILVTKRALGAERRTFTTQRAYINNL